MTDKKVNTNRYIWNDDKKEMSLPDTRTGEFFALQMDKYAILDLIGEGANGVVIKACNSTLNRIEAIKIWLPNKNKKTKDVDFNQYLAEIRKISNLKNNNIVTIYDAWQQDGYYFASTEFIEGESLKDWLNSPFYATETECRRICHQLLETVLYYQTEGIIHGDIHTKNILIDKNNQVHIIDFGTSYFTRNKKSGRASVDREINLLYEDVKLILGDSFDDELLILSFNVKNKRRRLITDNINPILFTKTLLQYCEIISLKENTGKILDKDILAEYCSYVAFGFYFNLDKIIKELKSWSSLKNVTILSVEYLYRIIHNNIFTDDWPEPYHTYDLFPKERFYPNEIEAVSAYVYYELSKNYFTQENHSKTKKEFFRRYKGFLNKNSFDELWNTLKCYENNSLFSIMKLKSIDFQNNSALISNYLENIRGILSTLIPIGLNNNYLKYYYLLWIKMTEVRLNKKLHDKIMKEIAADYDF